MWYNYTMSNVDFDQTIKLVKTHIAAKELQEANNLLRKVVDYPTDFITYQATFPVIIDTFILLIEHFNIPAALKAAKTIQKEGIDGTELFNLAYALIDAEWPEFAANIFRMLYNSGLKEEAVVTEYAIALERSGYNEEAMKILQENLPIVEKSLYLSYVLAFNAINAGYPVQTKKAFELMKKNYDSTAQFHTTFLERVRNFITRHDAISKKIYLVKNDLREWHFIINGSILLYYSPFGWDQMHGRFGALQEDVFSMKIGVIRMAEAMKKLNLGVKTILFVDNYQSKILATALSKVTGLPLKEITPKNEDEKGLISLYKWDNLTPELQEKLHKKHDGQYMWVHSDNWIGEHGYEPDFVTHLSQYCSDPWEPQLRFHIEHGKSDEPLISKDVEEAVKQILDYKVEKKDFDSHDEFNKFLDALTKTMKPSPFIYEEDSMRNRSYSVNIVKSNSFRG